MAVSCHACNSPGSRIWRLSSRDRTVVTMTVGVWVVGEGDVWACDPSGLPHAAKGKMTSARLKPSMDFSISNSPQKVTGYASLPACSLGERPIDRNQTPWNWKRCVPRSDSYQRAFGRDCTLEAMRTRDQYWRVIARGVMIRASWILKSFTN